MSAAKTVTVSGNECRERAIWVLESYGVSDHTLASGRDDEWVAIEAELDRFSAYGFGRASQRRFLHAPHVHLDGLTPAEALAADDGAKSVLKVLRHSLAGLEAGS